MPTFTIDGIKFVFSARDQGERPHVHVEIDERGAKIWISPVELAENFRLKKHELRRSLRITREHEKEIKKRWRKFFKKKPGQI